MIAIARKNLAYLISKGNPFAYKSHVSSFSPLRFSSTSIVISSTVHDVLVHKHHFSPQVASLASSHLARYKSPEKADSILSFLEDSGFSSTQLETIVKFRPRILTSIAEDDIKFKIKIFQDLGLSPEDIAKMVSMNKVILDLNAEKKIIPTLSLLKNLVGSNYDVARLLRKCGWFILADLEKTLLPNVELLKSCGIPMERIVRLLNSSPRCLLNKPNVIRQSVDKAKEMGFSQGSNMFVHAVRGIATISKSTWELKMEGLRDMGFSDSDAHTMFRKFPLLFTLSTKKIRMVKEFLLGTEKFDISSIVENPVCLGCSIEKRLKPRFQILGILQSKNLIKKWPCLGTILCLADDKFFELFISPYSNELGEVYATKSYLKSKRR